MGQNKMFSAEKMCLIVNFDRPFAEGLSFDRTLASGNDDLEQCLELPVG